MIWLPGFAEVHILRCRLKHVLHLSTDKSKCIGEYPWSTDQIMFPKEYHYGNMYMFKVLPLHIHCDFHCLIIQETYDFKISQVADTAYLSLFWLRIYSLIKQAG